MFPAWTWIVGFYLGAVIGSFLNVVIYRLPRQISLSKPSSSFCPSCKHPLGVLDLFPLFSWIFLGGKCRYCKAKVSSRYFFVELLNGLIWAGIWYKYFVVSGDPAVAIAYAAAASTLVAIIFIDWELYIIPDQINAFLFVVGWGLNIWLLIDGRPEAWTWGIPSSLAGWIVGVAVLWAIAFFGRVAFGKDAMGHGDIKMARGIGAVLFPAAALMSFGLAVFLGAIIGGALVIIQRLKGGIQVLDDAIALPKGCSRQTVELAERHRKADPDQLSEVTPELIHALQLERNERSDVLQKEVQQVIDRLEADDKTWIGLPEDEAEVHLAQTFIEGHSRELDEAVEAILARRWNEASVLASDLLVSAKSAHSRTGLGQMKELISRRSRFYIVPAESIRSLLKSGIGYFLCVDIIGLFVPKLYEAWFEVPAYESFEEMEDFPIGKTTIPFGPYLALGAIVATVFQADLRRGWDSYVNWISGPEQGVEQTSLKNSP